MNLFARHDFDEAKQVMGMFPVSDKQSALELNKQGFGIHWCCNSYTDTRKDCNITKINYWTADIDEGEKSKMLENINRLPLKPTILVETKKGYHLYFKAQDATCEKYRMVQSGLIKRLNSDPALKSPSRTLRCAGYMHLKDPDYPFMVRVVSKQSVAYREQEMLFAYEPPKPKPIKQMEYVGDKADMLKPENWEKIFNLSCVAVGGRNNNFARYCLWLRDSGFSMALVENTLQAMNQRITNPLPQSEIRSILQGKFK